MSPVFIKRVWKTLLKAILSPKKLIYWVNLFFSPFPPKLTFTASLPTSSFLLLQFFSFAYPGDWWPPCPKARWQRLQGLLALSWRSRRWESGCCWAAAPPSAPSHSCMPWEHAREEMSHRRVIAKNRARYNQTLTSQASLPFRGEGQRGRDQVSWCSQKRH